jgi:ACS family hexuronate transporter-like MFS transporter
MAFTRFKGVRWWMMGLLMTGSIVNYLTRSTLGIAAPTILTDLHISKEQYSWVVATFQGAIMLQPICGYVIGYTPFFVALGVLDIIGAILLWTLVRERRPDLA